MAKNVSSDSPFEASIGFSRARRIGNVIAVSGTAPIADDGTTTSPGDVYGQTRRCLEIIVAAVAEAGGRPGDITRSRIMLVNIAEWEAAARAHEEVFREVRPAATFVEVSGFINKDWLVEVEVDAVVENE